MRFELKDRDASGRLGKLYTDHGIVNTPTLLPVINPNKIIISPKEMQQSFDVEMVITNSYIIRKHQELRDHALEKGVHDLIDFSGPIMTDSGTFQSYIYGSVDVHPLEIIEFQKNIGVDIGTILDVFGTPDQSYQKAKQGIIETVKRAQNSLKIKGSMGIACTIQGSIYPDLRRSCAEKLSALDADLYPIGGVVPLMEQQRYAELSNIILSSKKGMSLGKPTHLFGAGHPLVFPLAVALGCDLFDSSAYAKYAQQDRLIFPNGTFHLKDIEELFCHCPACSSTNASELKQLPKTERISLIARHNLYVSMQEIKRVRHAVRTSMLWELVEQKAAENPWLSDAMTILRKKKEKKWLEQFEPIHKKKAVIYTGPHTIHRPFIYRTINRVLEAYDRSSDIYVVLPDAERPYLSHYSSTVNDIFERNPYVEIIIASAIGPVPIFLDEMYPFAQSVFPHHIDQETKRIAKYTLKKMLNEHQVIIWNDHHSLEEIPLIKTPHKVDFDRRRVMAVASMQFGPDSGSVLFSGDLSMLKSKKTLKIRNVYVDEDHIVSLRAADGLFTLKLAGGKRLHDSNSSPRYRVIVEDDAIPFIKDGKSVFSKFVVASDPLLRPFDECVVVDRTDEFLGVGRCLLNADEMKDYSYGQAVKMREHIS